MSSCFPLGHTLIRKTSLLRKITQIDIFKVVLLTLSLFITVSLLIGCSSNSGLDVRQGAEQNGGCSTQNTYACMMQCNNDYGDAGRPLYCYRTYCKSNAEIYGLWCNEAHKTSFVTMPHKDLRPDAIMDYKSSINTKYECLMGGKQCSGYTANPGSAGNPFTFNYGGQQLYTYSNHYQNLFGGGMGDFLLSSSSYADSNFAFALASLKGGAPLNGAGTNIYVIGSGIRAPQVGFGTTLGGSANNPIIAGEEFTGAKPSISSLDSYYSTTTIDIIASLANGSKINHYGALMYDDTSGRGRRTAILSRIYESIDDINNKSANSKAVLMLDFYGMKNEGQLANLLTSTTGNANPLAFGMTNNVTHSQAGGNSYDSVDEFHHPGAFTWINDISSALETFLGINTGAATSSNQHIIVASTGISASIQDPSMNNTQAGIYNTNGHVTSFSVYSNPYGSEYPMYSLGLNYLTGKYYNGSSPPINEAGSSNLAHQNYAYTSQYPSAFLYHLWAQEFYKGTSTDKVLEGTLNGTAGAANNLNNWLNSNGYVQAKSYNFLVAAALMNTPGSDGNFYGSDKPVLHAYSNLCGALKYNCVAVSVSNNSNYLFNSGTSFGTAEGAAGIGVSINPQTLNGDVAIGKPDYKPNTSSQGGQVISGQAAAAQLTAAISLLQQAFEGVFANLLTFAIRHSATPHYGNNFGMNGAAGDGKIYQKGVYFTDVWGDNTNEERNLNIWNQLANRDIYVYTNGNSTASTDDDIAGTGGILGHDTMLNGSGTGTGTNIKDQYTNGNQIILDNNSTFDILSNDAQHAGGSGTGGGLQGSTTAHNQNLGIDMGGNRANTFEFGDVDTGFDLKLPWQGNMATFYESKFVYCKNGASCSYNSYSNDESNANYTVLDVKLEGFNEHKQVIKLFMLNPALDPKQVETNGGPTQGQLIEVVYTCKTDSAECMNTPKNQLMDLFKKNPTLFTLAPSNIYGYGVLDMKQTMENLNYMFNTSKDQSPQQHLASQLLLYYYNSNLVPSSEFGNILYPTPENRPTNGSNPIITDNPQGGLEAYFSKYNVTALGTSFNLDLNSRIMTDQFAPTALSAMINASSMGMMPVYRPYQMKLFNGASLTAVTSMFATGVRMGGQIVNQFGFHYSQFIPTQAERYTNERGLFLIDGVTYSQSSAVLNGIQYEQKLNDHVSFKVASFGDKNSLSLTNLNDIGSFINRSGLGLFAGQQSGFMNPYLRHVGYNFLSSAYSSQYSFTNERLYLRTTVVDSNNPMMMNGNNYLSSSYLYGINSPLGGMGMGPGGQRINSMLYESELAYISKDKESFYSLSYGNLNEANSVLGLYGSGGLLTVGGAITQYADFKMIQKFFNSSYYLMGNFSIGRTIYQQGSALGVINNFSDIMTQKMSAGIVKKGLFSNNDKVGFIYTEPNRFIRGNMELLGFNTDGVISPFNIGMTSGVRERQYELMYGINKEKYSVTFSLIRRTNPYHSPYISGDNAFMLRYNFTW